MYPYNQHLLIVRTVEDPDIPPGRKGPEIPPEIIVIEFLACRYFEAGHLNTLWVNPRHHMLDGTVFTGCVKGLEINEKSIGVLGIQLILLLGKQPYACPEALLCIFL